MARVEGLFAGVSSGGAISAALRLNAEVENCTIVAVITDRGDRYLSTGVFSKDRAKDDPKPCAMPESFSALSRLMAYPGPHFVLFMEQPPQAEGEEGSPGWEAGEKVLESTKRRLEEAGGTLQVVHVGD